MCNVYLILFVNGLHGRSTRRSRDRILRPFGKYFPSDSIVKGQAPSSRHEKAQRAQSPGRVAASRVNAHVFSSRRSAGAPRMPARKRDYRVETFDVSNYSIVSDRYSILDVDGYVITRHSCHLPFLFLFLWGFFFFFFSSINIALNCIVKREVTVFAIL